MSGLPRILARLQNRLPGTDCQVKFLTEDDVPEVKKFLKTFYYTNEPICASLKVAKRPTSIKALEAYALKSMASKVSLVVVNEDQKIVALCLNRIAECSEKKYESDDPEYKKILDLVHEIDRDYNLFKMYNIEQYMLLDIVCVNPQFGGLGIGTQLIELTRHIAIDSGLKLMRMCCTDHYTAKGASKLRFTPYYTIRYAEYEVDGEQVFKPEHPHIEFCACLQRLNEFSLLK